MYSMSRDHAKLLFSIASYSSRCSTLRRACLRRHPLRVFNQLGAAAPPSCAAMSSPEDGAKAYALAMKHSQSGNLEAALKWARKSISIDPSSTRAKILLTSLEKGHMPGYDEGVGTSSTAANGGVNGSASTEGLKRRPAAAAANGSAGTSTKGKATSSSSSKPPQREYTEEQMRIVVQVNKAGRENDYYGVLMLKKSDEPDENAIKKGYRKLALQLHPDKNGAPGADEAFKIVSKAFTILSDGDKRAIYDRYGGDPDARGGGGGGGAGAAGFRGAPANFRAYGPGMGAEIDPNDLFNMFFGGGMGSGFGGTTFAFGGPGVHVHQFGGGGSPFQRPTRQGGAGMRNGRQATESTPVLLQLLPLLILGLFSLLSYAPTLFSTPDPQYSWQPHGSHRMSRHTPTHNVQYFVDQTAWHTHPWVAATAKAAQVAQKEGVEAAGSVDPAIQAEGNRAASKIQAFERRVENQYKNVLYEDCQRRREYQARRVQAAQGSLFGIGADREAEQRIRAERFETCDRLQDFGIRFDLNI